MARRATLSPAASPLGAGGWRILAATLFLLLLAGGVGAQTVCIPEALGVPGLSGPPQWLATAPLPERWQRPDDPRWRGAFLHVPMPASAATDHLTFRALRTASDLFLQWRITVDPLLDQQDRLRVAFSPGAGKPDVLINLQPFNSAGVAVNAEPPAAVSAGTRTTGSRFGGLPAPPAWLTAADTRPGVWRNLGERSWTVSMRVPISSDRNLGLDLDPSFRFWFEVRVSHTPTSVVYYRYPEGVPYQTIYDLTTGTVITEGVEDSTAASAWQAVRRDVAPATAGCIRGVSLTVTDVGTVPEGETCDDLGSALSSEIKLLEGGSPATNTFCARPLNETGGTIGEIDENGEIKNGVKATFRIADWGSQPLTDSLSLWTTLNPMPAEGVIGSGAQGALAADWPLTAAHVCSFSPQPAGFDCRAFPPPTRYRHQCLLVELDGPPGVTFSTSSVYRNMDFVGASTFTREAKVSVVGLPARPTPEPRRDLYLYVQTDNMPARVQPPDGWDDEDQEGPFFRAAAGSTVPGPTGPVPPLPKTSYEELRETEPTYQVHAFHDTGITETVDGRTVKILAPQTSFGYFVRHEGPLEGWRHELQGAQQIADDYYRIGVPENGTSTVTTVIEAVEGAGQRRWSFSLHAGGNDPRGPVANLLNGDTSYGLDLEYRFRRIWALELFYGRDSFDANGRPALDVDHLSLNARAYFGTGALRPFVLAGAGLYDFSPGDRETGYDAGAGLQFNLTPRLAVEADGRYHWVDTGSDTFELPDLAWGLAGPLLSYST